MPFVAIYCKKGWRNRISSSKDSVSPILISMFSPVSGKHLAPLQASIELNETKDFALLKFCP